MFELEPSVAMEICKTRKNGKCSKNSSVVDHCVAFKKAETPNSMSSIGLE